MNINDVEQCTLDAKHEALQMKKSPRKIEEMITSITELGIALIETKASEHKIEQERVEKLQQNERGADIKLLERLQRNTKNYIGACGDTNIEQEVTNLSHDLLPSFIKNLAIKHLVGIQPMSEPCNMIYVLTKKYTQALNRFEEDVNDHKISLEIISRAVEAQSRRFSLELTIGLAQDLRGELSIANELAEDIYEEVKHDIVKCAHRDNIDVSENYTVGKLMAIIGKYGNEIARNTARGAANWIIVSETVVKILKPQLRYDLTLTNRTFGYLNYVGHINGMTVYLDPKIKHNKLLMGYKGGHGETDAGYFYCPYIPIMAHGPIMNAHTFESTVHFIGRHGIHNEQQCEVVKTEGVNGSETVTTLKHPNDYFYDVTLDGLPILDSRVIETPKNVLDDKLKKTFFSDLFDSTMKILD